MNRINIYILIIGFSVFLNCTEKKSYQINLKWHKAYPNDTLEKNIIGLQWCLSFLGSTITNDSIPNGITYNDSIISLNINELGFTKSSADFLAQLSYKLKKSEVYQTTNSADLGRFMALTIGSSYHYYRIVNVPEKLSDYYNLYQFDSLKGYINNSSVSHVDRIITFSNSSNSLKQAFIATEIDSISKEIIEYETMEIMPNAQLKFGVYNEFGVLKNSGNPIHTKAGKPAKCIWCHEVNIQPLFNDQRDINNFLPHKVLNDSLEEFNNTLHKKQDSLWQNKVFKNKRQHTLMEITYISFMEPSLERLCSEWSITKDKAVKMLEHIETHRHHEFDFLGDLYHRKDIMHLAPWNVLKVPEGIREGPKNEIDYLK